jgi:HAE1 family hydrophobic/amphiphilic exporter-1
MNNLYQAPLRVYLALGALALWGLICGLQLPISLFPNSSKPTIGVTMSYGEMSAPEFLHSYGMTLESTLQSISIDGTEVDQLKATYSMGVVRYRIEFKWGADAKKALREVQNVVSAFTAPLSLELRNSTNVSIWSDNEGFIAVSFYSQKRTLDELFKLLEPQLVPQAQRVKDAVDAELWNPTRKEIRIELNPEKTAMLGIFPRDVANAVLPQLGSLRGGSVMEGFNQLSIQMPAIVRSVEDLNRAVIPTRAGKAVHLSDIAHIDLGTPSNNARAIKTSGVPSLILFANPRAGGNVKRMAEDVLAVVDGAKKNFPPDVGYKIIVDPSEFIRSAVTNVVHEVVIAAMLAVFVLFLFIGNLRNVITAAIEIPLSIVLAFILMRLTGINLNLISLGGLALSAGMNVDGSVVVMENIFRHFDEVKGPISARDRVRILCDAVAEVRFPILASTIASLVVFIPLAFTSQLTNAILGDLAMAVVFSHGFSAVVALILVPTVRLQLMKDHTEKSDHSFLEPYLRRLETFYGHCLEKFLARANLRRIVYASLTAALALLLLLVLPHLPREIVGKPDTDWIVLNVSTKGNSLTRQMESATDSIEARMLDKFGERIRYTFAMVGNPNSAQIMARLHDKSEMLGMWKSFETEFPNTPDLQFNVSPWNPSELEIPNPPNFLLTVRGSNLDDRVQVGREIYDRLVESKLYPRNMAEPELTPVDTTDLVASPEQWTLLANAKGSLSPSDLADISRVATLGRRIWQMPIDGQIVPIQLTYPSQLVKSVADLEALPVGVNGKLIPLKALADVRRHPATPDSYRENNTDIIKISARIAKGTESEIPSLMKKATTLVNDWKKENEQKHSSIATIEDADKELNEALSQLSGAVALSIVLIFITMVFQFGDIVNSALVLVSIPLGFIGVLISLFVFQSTLSLNSVLGIILLNGIAVANSIILVDFLKRLVDQGMEPNQAAVVAATKRLRPILMTSLTTGLGMLPVAMGFGEGGRILQPLGIAVVGGLSFSMLTTLMIVPALQVGYLNWKQKRFAKIPAQPVHRETWSGEANP